MKTKKRRRRVSLLVEHISGDLSETILCSFEFTTDFFCSKGANRNKLRLPTVQTLISANQIQQRGRTKSIMKATSTFSTEISNTTQLSHPFFKSEQNRRTQLDISWILIEFK